MKRVLALLMTVVLLVGLLPAGMVSASGGGLSLAQLREKYPHGAYWNHSGTTNKPGSYTWNPCTHHGGCAYSGSCGCNSYDGMAIQCMGFAYQLASLAYDCDPRGEWSANYNTSALNKLKAGDIVRYKNNGHSIFIIGVSGDTVTYADCNSDLHCKIKWDQTTTKASLKATFTYVKAAPYALEQPAPETSVLTLQYHAGGGTIDAAVTGHRYVVTDPDGVNMRSGAGTGNPVLTALPKGTEFDVKAGDTKKSGGYTWGKTTYNGTTGWVVISDFVEKTGALREGDYYLADSLVYRAADNALFTRTATLGTKVTLDTPAAFGLTRTDHRFIGWSTTPEGEPLYSIDKALKAEVLYPALEQGSATVTLYAVWACEHQYPTLCATTCTLCGAEREVTHDYDNVCDPDCNLCGVSREITHSYAAVCAEACDLCGATRQAEPHTFVDDVCTACGKQQVILAITTQPTIGYAPMGEKVSTGVEATGEGLTYQWYVRNEGQTKYYKSSITTATYTAVMSEKSKNRRVLCYVTDAHGNRLQTKTVLLREAVSITAQPKTTTVAKGKTAKVTVTASGDGLTYKWYLRSATGTKYSLSSVTTASYSVKMSDKTNGRRLICYVYDKYGHKVKSQTVMLKMK